MHIVLRNGRQSLFSVEVDLASPPTIVHAPDDRRRAAHLDWDRAIDDEHHLRRCPVCGCQHLYARKQVPQLAGFALIVLAAIVAMGLYGGGHAAAAVAVFALVITLNAAIYVVARRELVCYQCRSSFHGMPIRRDHPRWQKPLGQRYAAARKRGESVTSVHERAQAASSSTDAEASGDGDRIDRNASSREGKGAQTP